MNCKYTVFQYIPLNACYLAPNYHSNCSNDLWQFSEVSDIDQLYQSSPMGGHIQCIVWVKEKRKFPIPEEFDE